MSVDVAVSRRAFGQLWKGAAVVGIVSGGTAASSALSYVASFPNQASRVQLAATTSRDSGLAVLLGPVRGIGSVGGYTVYKGFAFLTTIGAVWAVFAATRVLRGEEEAGRWQLVVATGTRATRATAATLVALGLAVAIVAGEAGLLTAVVGRDARVGFGLGSSLLYGVSLSVAPAVFAAVGAVTSQLSGTRRGADLLGMAVVGAMFVLRMLSDAAVSARWLRWATPFGWVELIDPFGSDNAQPLIAGVLALVVLTVVALVLAARRDSGSGALASRVVARPRRFGLSSAGGLAVRLEAPVLFAWCVGVALAGVMMGVIGEMTTASIPRSITRTLANFGVHGDFTAQYFGVAFLLLASVVALVPASQIGRAADEETSGRLVHVMVGPTSRATWIAGRLAVASVGVVCASLLAGVGAWVGAASQGLDLRWTTMLGAGLNVVPTALVALAVGALVMAVAPRAAGRSVYLLVGWSLIIDLVASMVHSMAWLGRLSLFHTLALVPAQTARPGTIAITLCIAASAMGSAVAVFGLRSLRPA